MTGALTAGDDYYLMEITKVCTAECNAMCILYDCLKLIMT